MDIIREEEAEVYVLPRLFARGLEEILQSIFLYLDPQSLKNSKLTCTQWEEFIDRRIRGSLKARKILHRRLILNWRREDPVQLTYIDLLKLNQSERIDGILCKNKIILLWHKYGKHITAVCSATHEVLFSRSLPTPFSFADIGDTFIALADTKGMRILGKFTGKVNCPKAQDSKVCVGVKVVGSKIVQAQKCGSILVHSKDPVLCKWSVKEVNTKYKNILCISGNDSTLVIGLENRIMFWDMEKEIESENFVELPEDFCPTTSVNWTQDVLPDSMHLEFYNPFVLVALHKFDIFETLSKKLRIYNISTGEMIRHMEIDYHHIHFDGRFV